MNYEIEYDVAVIKQVKLTIEAASPSDAEQKAISQINAEFIKSFGINSDYQLEFQFHSIEMVKE